MQILLLRCWSGRHKEAVHWRQTLQDPCGIDVLVRVAERRHLFALVVACLIRVTILAGLETQTQNAAFLERKGPERKPWPRGKPLNRKK